MPRYDCLFDASLVSFSALSLLLAAILMSATSEVASAAAPIKLNGPLVTGGNVNSSGLAFSPDSSRVLYLADQDTDTVSEIFSVPSAGGTATKLNGLLVAGGDVLSLQFSPDSGRVLYLADQMTDGVNEIFSVPSAGGMATKLNGALVAGGDVLLQQFSPDSIRVLYLADQMTDGVNEIFSVPTAGGTATKLNGPLVAGGDVFSNDLQFSPDSSRVLYLADQTTDGVLEMFIVPSVGGVATKLNGPLVAGGAVFSQQFSPDSSRVVYAADQTTDQVFEIFSVPSAGGVVTKLNGALVAGGSVSTNGVFSPDSSRVLYHADQTTNDVFEIFSVPSAGGTATKLNGPLVAGGEVFSDSLQFSPNSSRVLYIADQTTDDVFEIFSVPSTGGTAVKLNGPLVAGGSATANGLQFSPDSNRVLYLADQTTDGVSEIFSVPSAGGTATKLNGPLVAGGDVSANGLQFSPDSSRVLYLADQTTDNVQETFIVPSAGGTAVKLNGPLVAGGNVFSQQFSPDGSLVLYLADQDTDGVNEIYVRIVRQHSMGGSGNWDQGTAWNHGGQPDEVMQVFVDGAGTVTASGIDSRTVNELVVGGGGGASTLTLSAGAGITALHGATINTGGALRGDGVLVADLVVAAGGEVRSGAGEQLTVSGVGVLNSGRVEAIGTSFALAGIEFDGAVLNSVSTGMIAGENATLRFQNGLTNRGAVALSFGTSRVFGDVTNSPSGTIAVAGNSGVTFFDDVTNGGTLNVAGGSTAVFFGALSGNGNVGGGEIQALGDLLPGASPGMMAFGGDLTLGPLTNLEIELGGLTAGNQFDQLVIAGDATLAGTLNVSLMDGFTLAAGQQFEILNVGGSLAGTFAGLADGALVGSFGGTDLYIDYTEGNTVALFTAGLPGDFDNDGDVDGRDFLVWQRGGSPSPLSPSDLADWQGNYGVGPLAAKSVAVPEPDCIALLISFMFLRRTRTWHGTQLDGRANPYRPVRTHKICQDSTGVL